MRKSTKVAAAVLILLLAGTTYVLYPPAARPVTFPGGKRFAFSIVDDTDLATLERIRPVYAVLDKYGIRTTKTVWVFESNDLSHDPNRGSSLADPAYRAFILDLQRRGFEIALHGVRGGSSVRPEIIKGLDEFRDYLGRYPAIHVNHSMNLDNVYWGEDRWSFPPYGWAYALGIGRHFEGDDPRSSRFWGDVLRSRIKYVNQFTFRTINLLDVTPSIPYRLKDKQYVRYWFPTSDGGNLDRFEELLSSANLDRLERDGGLCLVYAHMGAGSFTRGAAVDPRFEARIRDLASRNGWFVPASQILDYLRHQPGWRAELSFREEIRLETLFMWDRILLAILPAQPQ